MTHHADHGRRSADAPAGPGDPRNPGDAFLQREIDDNRRGEHLLIPRTLIALAVVAVLVVIREVFFA